MNLDPVAVLPAPIMKNARINSSDNVPAKRNSGSRSAVAVGCVAERRERVLGGGTGTNLEGMVSGPQPGQIVDLS
jgi:hypothetical protein